MGREDDLPSSHDRDSTRRLAFATAVDKRVVLKTLRALADGEHLVVDVGSLDEPLWIRVLRSGSSYRFASRRGDVEGCFRCRGSLLVARYIEVLLESRQLGLTGEWLVRPAEFDYVRVPCDHLGDRSGEDVQGGR